MEEFGKILKTFWPLILVVGQMVIGWMQWKLSRQFATKEELAQVEEEVDGHDTRIGDVEGKVLVMETEMRNMPTSKDICGLKESIATLSQTCKTLSLSVKRFEDYLIQKGQS